MMGGSACDWRQLRWKSGDIIRKSRPKSEPLVKVFRNAESAITKLIIINIMRIKRKKKNENSYYKIEIFLSIFIRYFQSQDSLI